MSFTDAPVAETFTAGAREELARASKIIQHCLDQLTDEQIAWRPQEIVCLTRMQLGDNYKFDWVPRTAEEGAPAR